MGDGSIAELNPAYGRQAAPLSVMTRTAGANALLTMLNENLVSRPNYSTYLNVPEGIQNEQQELINEGNNDRVYDTLTGRRTVGRGNAFGLYAGQFNFNPSMTCKPGLGIDDTVCQQAVASVISRRKNNNFMYNLENN
jgi:hypothetical protein